MDTATPSYVDQITAPNDAALRVTQRTFYDGLGRAVQSRLFHVPLADTTFTTVVEATEYDALGRAVCQLLPVNGGQQTFSAGLVTGCRTNAYPRTVTTYDALGRVAEVTQPDGARTLMQYQGRRTAVLDANNHQRISLADAYGQLIEVREYTVTITNSLVNWSAPIYATTRYRYDVLGNLETVTDTATPANVTTMDYDALGRKIAMSDPDMGTWTYAYDANGNLVRQTDAKGQRICFYYDPLNRLKGKTYGTGAGACPTDPNYGGYAVKYWYDEGGAAAWAIGRRTRMEVPGVTTSAWTYDLRGRVKQETKTINGGGTFTTQWGYDNLDHVAWMQYPNGNGGGVGEVVTYSYLPQGAVNTLSGASQYVQGTAYDAAGRIVRRQYGTIPEPLTTQYTYFSWTTLNGQGRLQVLQTGTASTYDSRQKLAYTYDAVGNVMSITDTKAGGTQIQAFTYDALDRLEKAQASGGTGGIYAQQTYIYDQLGNLTNNGNGTLTYGTQSAAPTCPDGALTKPHAVVSGNGNTYCYDANGNQVKRILGANTLTLTYDAENRLTTVSGATSASFVYDGDGNRVKSVVNGVTTYYIGNHFEWRSTTGNMGRYYYADGQRIAMRYGSTVYYLLGDHLGSTTLTVTGSGAKYAEQRYYPWGDTRYTYWKTPTAYQFTGQYHDTDLGLYFYNARYYDSALGRFLQADTIIPNPANPQSLNRYSYTLGNPLRYTDPTGHRECGEFCNNDKVYRPAPRAPRPVKTPPPTTTQILSGLDNLFTGAQVVQSTYRGVVLSGGNFCVASGIGPVQLVTRGNGILRIGAGVPWVRVSGGQAARQVAGVGSLAIATGDPAAQLARQFAPSGSPLARGFDAAGQAIMSWGTLAGLATTWGINIYDYTWGDHADANRTEFAAAMTVDTAALLSSTAVGAIAGGMIGGPVGAPIGAAVAGGLYLVYSLGPRETVILWTEANVIVPLYDSWLMSPSQSFSSGYYP